MPSERPVPIPPHDTAAGVRSDQSANVNIGEVFKGYFNSSEKVAAFCNLGIARFVGTLPARPRVADFGGGDGHLAAGISGFLAAHGKAPEIVVIDGNEHFLQRAREKGLGTIHGDITAIVVPDLDIAVSRAAFHYNSLAGQREILERVRESLALGGFFVNQISSGDQFNTALRNDISALPSLGRASKGSIHFLTPTEYIAMTRAAGFTTELVGYAPSNSWTPEEMFDRFHPPTETNEMERLAARNRFLQECMQLIRGYKDTTPIEGVTLTEESAIVTYQYPVFVSSPIAA